jgi:hypothetical protein
MKKVTRISCEQSCLAAVILLVAAVSLPAAEPATSQRPNILFALADDWGWPHAPAYGDKVVRTPTFDRPRQGSLRDKQRGRRSSLCKR